MTSPDLAFLALQAAVAGRFSLEQELGRGGMGVVYLARDVQLERPVAIKLLAPHLAARDDMRRRFLREARTAAQCFHPHIVPIHEVAEAGDLAWFVMGYVPGETLAERLRRAGPLTAEQLRRVGREIGWALAYAHERGVVHRDVKPENILLEQGTGRALITDFGIAWQEPRAGSGTSTPATGEVMGTARYMAPEQALGEVLDGRADLYALGVTLYVAATGRHPYEGRNAIAVMVQQQTQPAASVRQHAPRLPAALADAIDQCLAPAPADRFASAAAFVAAIERSPDGAELAVEARPARAAAQGTLALLDWTFVIALCGVFFVLGESSGWLGRAMMTGIVQAVLAGVTTATALRAGETLVAARRALREGASAADVADAIAPPPVVPDQPASRLNAFSLLLAGFGLALAQGTLSSAGLPDLIQGPIGILSLLLPPLLVHRGLNTARRGGTLSAWWYSVVRKPLAERLVGWLGGRPNAMPRALPADAPTEVLLGQAAEQILARLPQSAREQLPALPAVAAALAAEAATLRARALALSGEQRQLRAAAASPAHDASRQALADEQDRVQQRLGTTIAALESIRLDLLRLEAGQTQPGVLTEQMDVLRDLQRHVDAVQELRRELQEPTSVRERS